jgi:hypothetical protein
MSDDNAITVFINTKEKPIRIIRLGLFRAESKRNHTSFQEMCELVYPHPQAPRNAVVSVYRFMDVRHQLGTMALIKQTIDAMSGIKKITVLDV